MKRDKFLKVVEQDYFSLSAMNDFAWEAMERVDDIINSTNVKGWDFKKKHSKVFFAAALNIILLDELRGMDEVERSLFDNICGEEDGE